MVVNVPRSSKSSGKAPVYFPRRLALVAPQGESVYEFVVSGSDRIGMLSDMARTFAKHYVNLTSVDLDSIASGEFVLIVFADFRNSDAKPEQVRKELSSLRSVKTVVFGRAVDILFERFMFPITAGGSNRAIILPVSALVGYESAVIEKAGEEGERHLLDTGRPVGLGLASTIRSYMPWDDAEALVAASVDAMRALGWGLCTLDLSDMQSGRVSVTVRNPIFSGIGYASPSWLLIGVISGLLEDLMAFPNQLVGRPAKSKDEVLTFQLSGARESGRSSDETPSASGKRKARAGRQR